MFLDPGMPIPGWLVHLPKKSVCSMGDGSRMVPLKDNYLNLEKNRLFRYHCSRSLTGGQRANIPSTVGYL